HLPLSGSQVSPVSHFVPKHASFTQLPLSQRWPGSHATSAQLGSHLPSRQTSSDLQPASAHGSLTQSVLTGSHSSPLSQPSPRQLFSTQRPLRLLQMCPLSQLTPSQRATHAPTEHRHGGPSLLLGAQAPSSSRISVLFAHACASQVSFTQKHSPLGCWMSARRPLGHDGVNSIPGKQCGTHSQPMHLPF